jgi:hypothetical protein
MPDMRELSVRNRTGHHPFLAGFSYLMVAQHRPPRVESRWLVNRHRPLRAGHGGFAVFSQGCDVKGRWAEDRWWLRGEGVVMIEIGVAVALVLAVALWVFGTVVGIISRSRKTRGWTRF